MIFHNSTTIWHNPRIEKSFYKESRYNFLLWDALKSAGKTTLKTAGTLVKFGWTVSKPIRYPIRLAWGGIKKTAGLGNKGFDYTEWGLRYTREATKGVFYTGLGKSLFEVAKGPLNFLKHNLVGNTRDVLKDVFTLKTPRNILKSPKYAWEGFREGLSETRKNIGDIFSNVKTLSPLKAINSTRKAIWSLVKTPFKTIYKPARAVLDTPVQMGNNIGKSVYAYPYHLYKAPGHLRNGYNRVKGAHNVATSEMQKTDIYHFKQMPGSMGSKLREWKEKAGKKYVEVSGMKSKGKGGAEPATAPA